MCIYIEVHPGEPTVNLGPVGTLSIRNPIEEEGRFTLTMGTLTINGSVPPHSTRNYRPGGQATTFNNDGPGPLVLEVCNPIRVAHLPQHSS